MTATHYDTGLDRNPANFQPLTPHTLLERAAQVFPDQLAIVHGGVRRDYREFYARSRTLASAMLHCRYGVPMTGAVLNTMNPRLDAALTGCWLDHGETKVFIVDREFSKM